MNRPTKASQAKASKRPEGEMPVIASWNGRALVMALQPPYSCFNPLLLIIAEQLPNSQKPKNAYKKEISYSSYMLIKTGDKVARELLK